MGTPIIAAVVIGIIIGIYGGQILEWTITCAWLYTYAVFMGESLLTQVSIRLTEEQWRTWMEQRRWGILFLGLPIAVVIWLYPMLAVVLLDVEQVMGAAFIHITDSDGTDANVHVVQCHDVDIDTCKNTDHAKDV